MNWRRSTGRGRAAALGITSLLALSTLAGIFLLPAQKASASGGSDPALNGWVSALSNLFGPTSSNPRIQFGWSWSGINSIASSCGETIGCYADMLQKYFVPHNIYWFSFAYQWGDANTSSTCDNTLCPQTTLSNFLSAADEFGMHVLIEIPTYGFDPGGEPSCKTPLDNWQTETLNFWDANSPSSLAEVNSAGNTVCVLRLDYTHQWIGQLERDVYELYKDYGTHPSFGGVQVYLEFQPPYGQAYTNYGFSNQTIANFTRSSYYVNMNPYEPYYNYTRFANGVDSWKAISTVSGSGTTNSRTYTPTYGAASNSFYANQTSSTANPITIAWVPKNGLMWQTNLVANETLYYFPEDSNHGVSTVTATFNFQQGNNHGATESYTVNLSPTYSQWNRMSVNWFTSYLTSHNPKAYNNLTSVQLSLSWGSSTLTGQLEVAAPITFQTDWLQINKNSPGTVPWQVLVNDINAFESPITSHPSNPSWNTEGGGYESNVVHGNSLPSGTAAPLVLQSSQGEYAYESHEYAYELTTAANYCQTLFPNCIWTTYQNDAPNLPGNNGYVNYYGYSLQGNQPPSFFSGNGIGYGGAQYFAGAPNYFADEALGFQCFGHYPDTTPSDWSCNNGGYNPAGAIPYELTNNYVGQAVPLVWIQSSYASFVANDTNPGSCPVGGDCIPSNVGATVGQDYLYNLRNYAMTAADTLYPGRQTGYSTNPVANVLYVTGPSFGDSGESSTGFLSAATLSSLGFNVTSTTPSFVKDYDLAKFNSVVWDTTDQPYETNMTTYNDLANAINNDGVGLVVSGNAGNSFGASLPASLLTNCYNNCGAPLAGVVAPSGLHCYNQLCLMSSLSLSSGSIGSRVFSPYGSSLSVGDLAPGQSVPKTYIESVGSDFVTDHGTVLAAINGSLSSGWPIITEMNGTGSTTPPAGAAPVFWIGNTESLGPKQQTIMLNILLYASGKSSDIPYIYTSPSDPATYNGVSFSVLGNNAGSDLLFFSDYSASVSSATFNYKFRASTLGLGSSWIALNTANMQVVNSSTSAVVSLPLTMKNQTWAPIYVANQVSTKYASVYTNEIIKSSSLGTSSATYTMAGPHGSGGWLVIHDTDAPQSVTANNTGTLPSYSSLSSLVTAVNATYHETNQYGWQPAYGWFFDSVHSLLYIAFVEGSTQLTVNNPASSGAGTGGGSSSFTTTTSQTTTSQAQGARQPLVAPLLSPDVVLFSLILILVASYAGYRALDHQPTKRQRVSQSVGREPVPKRLDVRRRKKRD
jgi:hypothetical protein